MNLQEIETNCLAVRELMDTKIDRHNPDEVTGKLNDLSSIQGLIAEVLAQAERCYNRKAGLILDQIKNLKAGEQKLKLNSICADEIYFLRLSENYNKEIHYQIELMRTQISYLKEEKRIAQFTQT